MTPRMRNEDGPQPMVNVANRFPQTSWTLIGAVREGGDGQRPALEEFTRRYYRPAYAYITAILRDRGEAEDLTQEFFTVTVVSGRLFKSLNQEQGRFRPFLKTAIRHHLIDWVRKQGRTVHLEDHPDTEDGGWEGIGTTVAGPDRAYHRAWVEALLEEALGKVQRICMEKNQDVHFELFRAYYLSRSPEPPSWESLAVAYGLEDGKQARSRAETVARHFRIVLRRLVSKDLGPVPPRESRAVDEEIATLQSLLEEGSP